MRPRMPWAGPGAALLRGAVAVQRSRPMASRRFRKGAQISGARPERRDSARKGVGRPGINGARRMWGGRKSGVEGKSGDLGGRRIIKKKRKDIGQAKGHYA